MGLSGSDHDSQLVSPNLSCGQSELLISPMFGLFSRAAVKPDSSFLIIGRYSRGVLLLWESLVVSVVLLCFSPSANVCSLFSCQQRRGSNQRHDCVSLVCSSVTQLSGSRSLQVLTLGFASQRTSSPRHRPHMTSDLQGPQ